MSKRQVLLGYVIVLALSLAIPAFGASGAAGIKALAKKALSAATGAQTTASNAQQAAGNASDAAQRAQGTANNALSKVGAAESAASAAQGAAAAAQNTANIANGTANAAKTTADAAATKTTVEKLSEDVGKKFGQLTPTEPKASEAKGNNIKEAIVACPEGWNVVSGGYHFTSGTAEVHVDEATANNGWRVQAQSGGDPYDFVVVANCIKP